MNKVLLLFINVLIFSANAGPAAASELPTPTSSQFQVVANQCEIAPGLRPIQPGNLQTVRIQLSAVDIKGNSVDAFAYLKGKMFGFDNTDRIWEAYVGGWGTWRGELNTLNMFLESCDVFRKSISVDTRHKIVSRCFDRRYLESAAYDQVAFVSFQNGVVQQYKANSSTCELLRQREIELGAIDAGQVGPYPVLISEDDVLAPVQPSTGSGAPLATGGATYCQPLYIGGTQVGTCR